MPSAFAVRLQIEAALAQRIPSALTPIARVIRPVVPTGVDEVEGLLEGGLQVGAISEFVGPESSGRTSLALSFVAGVTRAGSVCAWIDACNGFDPESAAAAGIDLARLLWVRCGIAAGKTPSRDEYKFALPKKYMVAAPVKKDLYGGGWGGHPRNEIKGMAQAIGGVLQPEAFAPRCAEPQPRVRAEREIFAPQPQVRARQANARTPAARPWNRIEQALRVTDLVLQAGGFSAIVLDMASIAPEYASRVPLATWFRYRAAAERMQASFLLLTQHACAKSSGELLLRFQPGEPRNDETTVFTGLEHSVEVERRRFTQAATNVVSIREPPQRETGAVWRSRSSWAGPR